MLAPGPYKLSLKTFDNFKVTSDSIPLKIFFGKPIEQGISYQKKVISVLLPQLTSTPPLILVFKKLCTLIRQDSSLREGCSNFIHVKKKRDENILLFKPFLHFDVVPHIFDLIKPSCSDMIASKLVVKKHTTLPQRCKISALYTLLSLLVVYQYYMDRDSNSVQIRPQLASIKMKKI